jgi:hypothetical protein
MSLEDHLPEDFDGREGFLEKFKDVPSLARSYKELQKSLGSSVRVPAPEASQEERSAFFQRLGAPDSPEGYEELEGAEEWSKTARAAAHRAHLTKDQWKTLGAIQVAESAQEREGLERGLSDSQESARSRYGDQYETMVEKAKKAMETLSEKNEHLAPSLEGIDLRDAGALELFSMVGDMMADGSSPVDGGTAEATPEGGNDIELAMRIRELMKMPSFQNRRDPENEKVQYEYREKLKELKARGYHSVFDPRLKNNPW